MFRSFIKPYQTWDGYYIPSSGSFWTLNCEVKSVSGKTFSGLLYGKEMTGTIDGDKVEFKTNDGYTYSGIHNEGTISGHYTGGGSGQFMFYHPVQNMPDCCERCGGKCGCDCKAGCGSKLKGCMTCGGKCKKPPLPSLPSLPKIDLSFFRDQGEGKKWKGEWKADDQSGDMEAMLVFKTASGISEENAKFTDLEFSGSGSDSVGAFSIVNGWTGTKEAPFGGFQKRYSGHTVYYVGAWKNSNKKLVGTWSTGTAIGKFEFEQD
eukprot:TRINITY_DN302_c0_g1_i1.p2 TRINITY_DN302_c0_g1~~TRINITY_DN302_c0_g1_i1.p2  ORF type:complete len:263 (-),score=63.07 TRINITY_DN302_c0_g1_i1:239-1027(-)